MTSHLLNVIIGLLFVSALLFICYVRSIHNHNMRCVYKRDESLAASRDEIIDLSTRLKQAKSFANELFNSTHAHLLKLSRRIIFLRLQEGQLRERITAIEALNRRLISRSLNDSGRLFSLALRRNELRTRLDKLSATQLQLTEALALIATNKADSTWKKSDVVELANRSADFAADVLKSLEQPGCPELPRVEFGIDKAARRASLDALDRHIDKLPPVQGTDNEHAQARRLIELGLVVFSPAQIDWTAFKNLRVQAEQSGREFRKASCHFAG